MRIFSRCPHVTGQPVRWQISRAVNGHHSRHNREVYTTFREANRRFGQIAAQMRRRRSWARHGRRK